eukprot:TRINITY_DN554_c0_g1_i1.p2 TRINITY_DN554_c0_g1~~TRINITY_DN554_c0_g1_i1.p2  ORF type:complete len:230 (-),score=134.07 TRINITY_DN554_c0_g1_i1:100-789(-)
MGITRSSFHKRRATGGKRKLYRSKRKFEMGRPAASTKLGAKRIHQVRGRGGNIKHRALRLDTGNFSWGTETVTRKTRVLGVVYNASNNELVRTNTLVKNSIIQIDATPFRQWYERHYGVSLGKKKIAAKDSKVEKKSVDKKKKKTVVEKDAEAVLAKKSRSVLQKLRQRARRHTLDTAVEEQFSTGRLYACISSRPGQSGRCDGYVLEGPELDFYLKKLNQKKKTTKTA